MCSIPTGKACAGPSACSLCVLPRAGLIFLAAYRWDDTGMVTGIMAPLLCLGWPLTWLALRTTHVGDVVHRSCGKLYAPMVVLPSFGTCSRVSMHLWLRGLSVAWRGVMRRSFFAGLQILVDELVS